MAIPELKIKLIESKRSISMGRVKSKRAGNARLAMGATHDLHTLQQNQCVHDTDEAGHQSSNGYRPKINTKRSKLG